MLQGQLGYIAANEAHLFEHPCTPGYLLWAANAMHVPNALLGAAVECLPSMRAVNIQTLPEELVHAADLSTSLHPKVWQALEQLHLESTFCRCQITGLGALAVPGTNSSPQARLLMCFCACC